MNNQQQGSRTGMVRQDAHIFPVPATIPPPTRQLREEAAAQRFALMARAVLDQAGAGGGGGAGTLTAAPTAPAPGQPHQRPRKRSHAKPPALPTTPTREEARRATYAPARLKVNRPAPFQSPPLADLLDLEALRPRRGKGAGTAGAGALAQLLDFLVRHAIAARPDLYQQRGSAPRQVVLHLSAEMLAATLEKNQSTYYAWVQLLQTQGYLHARPHYTTVTTRDGQRVTVVDGTLYAIRVEPGHQAHLSYEDLTRSYRDLEADREAGRTAWKVMQQAALLDQAEAENPQNKNTVLDDEKNIRGSTEFSISSKYLKHQLQTWAVTPGQVNDPLNTDPRIFSADELGEAVQTVQSVIYLLPTVAEAHVTKRAALVGILGAALARALNDEHSRRWYCRLIWNAWSAETQGRGGLQVLAAQLARLDVDRREWGELCRPAALLAARLRAA